MGLKLSPPGVGFNFDKQKHILEQFPKNGFRNSPLCETIGAEDLAKAQVFDLILKLKVSLTNSLTFCQTAPGCFQENKTHAGCLLSLHGLGQYSQPSSPYCLDKGYIIVHYVLCVPTRHWYDNNEISASLISDDQVKELDYGCG